ncbi:MAG TPA: DUF2946 family protein [Rhodocyclaceae bacterium]|nr:DUF2946 family protein [Rhodocyclaceae bacterium]
MIRAARPFISLIAALLLVLAQQSALAHMIGHAGIAAEASIKQGEEQHGAALSISHICTTCVAFAALGGFAPSTGLPPLPTTERHELPPDTAAVLLGQRPLTFRARGPPAFL